MDNVLKVILLLHLAVPGLLLFNLLSGQGWIQAIQQGQVQGLAQSVIPCVLLAVAAFITAHKLIPSVAVMTQAAGMHGKDLNKKDGKIMYVPLFFNFSIFYR